MEAVAQTHAEATLTRRTKKKAQLLLSVSGVLNMVAWVLLLWKIPFTTDTIFLHYNIYFGVDLTGSWFQLLWIPGSGLALLLINTAVVLYLRYLESIVREIVLYATLCMEAMIVLAVTLLVLLNG